MNYNIRIPGFKDFLIEGTNLIKVKDLIDEVSEKIEINPILLHVFILGDEKNLNEKISTFGLKNNDTIIIYLDRKHLDVIPKKEIDIIYYEFNNNIQKNENNLKDPENFDILCKNIVELGFTIDQAKESLRKNNYNQEKAIDSCFNPTVPTEKLENHPSITPPSNNPLKINNSSSNQLNYSSNNKSSDNILSTFSNNIQKELQDLCKRHKMDINFLVELFLDCKSDIKILKATLGL